MEDWVVTGMDWGVKEVTDSEVTVEDWRMTIWGWQ